MISDRNVQIIWQSGGPLGLQLAIVRHGDRLSWQIVARRSVVMLSWPASRWRALALWIVTATDPYEEPPAMVSLCEKVLRIEQIRRQRDVDR